MLVAIVLEVIFLFDFIPPSSYAFCYFSAAAASVTAYYFSSFFSLPYSISMR